MESLLASVLLVISPGDILISEIMYNPTREFGPDDSMEWVEIYNATNDAINLENCMVSDGNNQIFLDEYVLEPGAYLVICANTESFISLYGEGIPIVSWDGVWTKLSNAGDELIFYSSDGLVVDAVNFLDTWGIDDPENITKSPADGDGATLERISYAGDSGNSENWTCSIDFSSNVEDPDNPGSFLCWGTPGERNSTASEN